MMKEDETKTVPANDEKVRGTGKTSKSGKRTRMMVASQGEVTFQSVDRRTHEC